VKWDEESQHREECSLYIPCEPSLFCVGGEERRSGHFGGRLSSKTGCPPRDSQGKRNRTPHMPIHSPHNNIVFVRKKSR